VDGGDRQRGHRVRRGPADERNSSLCLSHLKEIRHLKSRESTTCCI
jgi:hypothetical protein